MGHKENARETLKIQQQGYYEINGIRIDFGERQRFSEQNSFLLIPEDGRGIIDKQKPPKIGPLASYIVVNQSTVAAIADMCGNGFSPALLNFVSAKNPA